MPLRLALAVAALVAVLCLASPTASAQQAVPLEGEGENIEPIARVPLEGANEVELAGDWAFVSLDKVLGEDESQDKEGGLAIVNVADPRKPYVQSIWRGSDEDVEDLSAGDVDLSPDGNLAALTNAHCFECEEGEVPWVVLLDVTDKSNPKLAGQVIDDGTMDYVHTSTLDNKWLYTNPQVAGFFPQPGNAHITVFDISNPKKPVNKGTIAPPGSDAGLAHDSYVDHRPDGRTLMYAASVHKSDVIDVTDPLNSEWLQSSTSTYTISHDVQPNHDRTIIVVDDEGAAGGQLDEGVSACGRVGSGPATVDSGSIHFFEAAEDGTFANGGAVHLGSFNAPTNVNRGACVAHVFWQAPDENRLTQAYYRTGAYVLDFENPAAAKMLGWFVPEDGAIYWSNKPHKGYMYATDMEGGLDVLCYTGEGGKRWPTTAGPAEVQRAARQGVPYVPIPGTSPTTPCTETPAPVTPPGQDPQPAPATSPPPATNPAPTPRRCQSRRRFPIRIRAPRGEHIRSAVVSVGGRRLKTLRPRGRRRTVRTSVSLRGLPRGTVRVDITVRTRSGKRIRSTRRYRTCTPRGRAR